MAFWNPFGWSEEDRLAIRSIVRPITQVASLAGSMGVTFASKGATDTVAGTTDAAAAAGADFDQPSTLIPEDPNAMGTMREWTTDQGINDPSRIITPEQQAATKGSFTADQQNIGADGYGISGVKSFDDQSAALKEAYFEQPHIQAQESILQETEGMGPNPFDELLEQPSETIFEPNASTAEGLVVEPVKKQPGEQYEVGDIIDESKPYGNTKSMTTDADGNLVVTGVTPETTQTTAEQVSTNAEAVSPTETPIGPENQTGSQAEADKTTPETDTRGRGGKEESKFWDLHDFSWDNLMKWLETKEGKKFFFEWGQKFTAMSGGAAPNRKKLTKKQAAAIRKKVKEKYGR